MKKAVKFFLLILLILFLFLLYIFFTIKVSEQKNIIWGVNFSQSHAEYLKLDPKKVFTDILKDLNVKNIKLIINWNSIEKKQNVFDFSDVDEQIKEAEKYEANIIYVVGMKTGRWPECHLPDWTDKLSKEEQQSEILEYIKETILRYKESSTIIAWQVENEPLFKFGVCPWYDKNFLRKEVELVKSIDNSRPVIISDSGEQSLWIDAARIGDIVGTTMYREIWVHITDKYGFYINLPIPVKVYSLKSQFIKKFFNKKVINVELQAEPWFSDIFKELPIEEQERLMNLKKFQDNIEYAKKSGFDTFYFWGTEWWYFMKEKHNRSEIWNEAKNYF